MEDDPEYPDGYIDQIYGLGARLCKGAGFRV